MRVFVTSLEPVIYPRRTVPHVVGYYIDPYFNVLVTAALGL